MTAPSGHSLAWGRIRFVAWFLFSLSYSGAAAASCGAHVFLKRPAERLARSAAHAVHAARGESSVPWPALDRRFNAGGRWRRSRLRDSVAHLRIAVDGHALVRDSSAASSSADRSQMRSASTCSSRSARGLHVVSAEVESCSMRAISSSARP
jgi:hypothetical protein